MSRHSSKELKKNTRTLTIALLIVLFGAVGSVVFVKRDAVANAISLATTHQPEAYTELSFIDSAHLPVYSPIHKVERVAFRIVNHEAKTMSYIYTVKQDITLIMHNTVTLQDGQSVTIPFEFTISTPGGATQLSVQLDGRSEHIDFRSNS